VPCGLGSDTAGSLRIPSACNGSVGMRPSKGRWTGTGVVPVTFLRDTPGPMGATVGDVALLDAVVHEEPTAAAAHLAGAKIVVPEDWIVDGPALAPETRRALQLAKAAFEKLGAQVRTHLVKDTRAHRPHRAAGGPDVAAAATAAAIC
jgi:Asp-tRNA(Asn)/Glu-tRNA(Gln) amidotransferase A subunit family amidase